MLESWIEFAKVIAPWAGGGAAGALITQFFKSRSSRTREVYLIERVNRQPDEFRGIRYKRSFNGAERDVSVFRTYQMTLHNTSQQHLRNDEIQFEFSSEDVEPWASRPARSKTALVPVEATPTLPWKKALRWKIPSLPPGDTIEFTFEVFEPSTENYEALLYPSANSNVVLKKMKGEPGPGEVSVFAERFHRIFPIGLLVFSLVVVAVSFAPRSPDTRTQLLEKASRALDDYEKAPSERERQSKIEEAIRSLIKAISEFPDVPPGGPGA